MNKPQYLIVHHCGGTDADPMADTSNHTFEIIDEYHKEKFNFVSSMGHYIGYHYFIDKSGKITQGRADTDEGAHTIGQNLSSLGICLAGNFDATMPTNDQIEALKVLGRAKMKEYNIPLGNVVPHRRFANKSCYGNKLIDTWAQSVMTPPIVVSYDKTSILKEIESHLNAAIALIAKIK